MTEQREIPDSVMDAFLAAMGWAGHNPRARELAVDPIWAVIGAWEAHTNPPPPPQCESTWWDHMIHEHVRCGYPAGHEDGEFHGYVGAPYRGDPDVSPMFTWDNEDAS